MMSKPNPAVLSILELRIREKIEQANSPYVGLIPDLLSEKDQEYVAKLLKGNSMSFRNVATGLKKFPALFVAFVVESIQSNMRAETSAIYGCLNLAMGKPEDTFNTPKEKDELWHSFRKACQKLGLPVSNRQFGPNYMVDTYLDQVAVFDDARKDVDARFHRFAKRNGLPDLVDVVECQNWYQSFCESLNTSLSVRVRRALQNDTSYYYLVQFIQNVETASNEMEAEKYSKTELPKLCFDGQSLTLVFDGKSEQVWSCEIDGESREIQIDNESLVLFLDSLAVKKILCESRGGHKCEFNLWADDRDNQLAVFNATTHHLVAHNSLADDGVVLMPATYLSLIHI